MSHQDLEAKLGYFADMSDEDLHAMQEAIMRERLARSSARVAEMDGIDSDSDRGQLLAGPQGSLEAPVEVPRVRSAREDFAKFSNHDTTAYARAAYPNHWMIQHLCYRLDGADAHIFQMRAEWQAFRDRVGDAEAALHHVLRYTDSKFHAPAKRGTPP